MLLLLPRRERENIQQGAKRAVCTKFGVCVYMVLQPRPDGCYMAPCSLAFTCYTILLHVAAWLPLVCEEKRDSTAAATHGNEKKKRGVCVCGLAHLDTVAVIGEARGNCGGTVILIQEHGNKHSLCLGPVVGQLGNRLDGLPGGFVVADLDDRTQVEDTLDLELAKNIDCLLTHHGEVGRSVQEAPLYHGAVRVLSGMRCNGISARIAEVSEPGGQREGGSGESNRGCHDLVCVCRAQLSLASFVLFLLMDGVNSSSPEPGKGTSGREEPTACILAAYQVVLSET